MILLHGKFWSSGPSFSPENIFLQSLCSSAQTLIHCLSNRKASGEQETSSGFLVDTPPDILAGLSEGQLAQAKSVGKW
jgi:hypothetical protein